MPIITRENYHSDDNDMISNSMVGDFMLSKEYFYKKHIEKSIPREITPAMKIGSIVDAMFSGIEHPFKVAPPRIYKKDDPEGYEAQKLLLADIPEELRVTQDQMNEAVSRANAIMKEPFYKWYKKNNAEFQAVLYAQVAPGIPGPVACGMADVITETKDVVYIDDGKSTNFNKVRTEKAWFYNCQEMGYLRQLAAYSLLWKATHRGDKRKIVTRHFCVYEAAPGVYKVKLFIIPQNTLRKPQHEFLVGVKEIFKTTEWKDAPVTWDSAIKLKDKYTGQRVWDSKKKRSIATPLTGLPPVVLDGLGDNDDF